MVNGALRVKNIIEDWLSCLSINLDAGVTAEIWNLFIKRAAFLYYKFKLRILINEVRRHRNEATGRENIEAKPVFTNHEIN